MSDERLQIELLDLRRVTSVEGRVLVHGQDEQTGKNHLMLEATDGRVHFIYYTREMEEERSQSLMKINSFLRLRRTGAGLIGVEDLGDLEKLLHNPRHFAEAARRVFHDAGVPADYGWGGWLGNYQAALRDSLLEVMDGKGLDQTRFGARGRHRSMER